jgi:hypothetical protein
VPTQLSSMPPQWRRPSHPKNHGKMPLPQRLTPLMMPVLAGLQGHLPGHDHSARTDATPSASALGMQSIDTLPAAASDAPGSIATSTSPPPDLLGGRKRWGRLSASEGYAYSPFICMPLVLISECAAEVWETGMAISTIAKESTREGIQ